ncbi:MAG TPA: DbpA RNA binding domain-containing protein, partial [Nitrolancea sp.]|nr:DbpA RNA binding domain-containing protein [Nitrolancea sp.]
LNVGRAQSIRPTDIVGAIANEAQIPGKSIGQIDIFDNHTYVDVPEAFAERVVRALNRSRLRGKSVHVEIAATAVPGSRQ